MIIFYSAKSKHNLLRINNLEVIKQLISVKHAFEINLQLFFKKKCSSQVNNNFKITSKILNENMSILEVWKQEFP